MTNEVQRETMEYDVVIIGAAQQDYQRPLKLNNLTQISIFVF